MITQAQLKELLHYDPDTGIFTWLVHQGSASPGKVAGCLNKDHGYMQIRINRKTYRLHRLAWFYVHGEWPDEIDHDNRIKTDNRLKNLTNTSRVGNMRNVSMLKANTSGFTGVSWCRTGRKWRVRITVNNKKISLGSFADILDAANARKKAEIKYGFHENHGRK